MRYNLYSPIHRYIRHKFTTVESVLARTDFRFNKQFEQARTSFGELVLDLKIHADKEDKLYHPLFKNKGSTTHLLVENDHKKQESEIEKINNFFVNIENSNSNDAKLTLGYSLYLAYTNFHADNLKHLIQEENVLMPELQKLYSDDELRAITLQTYKELPVDIIHVMCESFFPLVNRFERYNYLVDLKEARPNEFKNIWEKVSPTLEDDEHTELMQSLILTPYASYSGEFFPRKQQKFSHTPPVNDEQKKEATSENNSSNYRSVP